MDTACVSVLEPALHPQKADTAPASEELEVPVRERERERDGDTTNWNLSGCDKCGNGEINKLVWGAHKDSLEGQARTSQRR